MTRRAPAALLISLVLVVVGAASCSSGDDASDTSTTQATTTTTTVPPPTDEEIIDNINEQLRPALEGAFSAEEVDCIISVLEEGGTGELNADEVVPEYQSRCGVTVTRVTGVITGATLVDQGATAEQGTCVADAISKMEYEAVAALGEEETNAIYELCGVDIDALSGGG